MLSDYLILNRVTPLCDTQYILPKKNEKKKKTLKASVNMRFKDKLLEKL